MIRTTTPITTSCTGALAVALAVLLLPATPALARGGMPAGIEEKPGAQVPLDVPLVSDNGEAVTLGRWLDGSRPAILTIGYFRCEELCDVLLNGLVEGMKEIDLSVGTDFDIISISIHPMEGPELAARKKQSYLQIYQRPGAARGWHFCTGSPDNVGAIADAVGWGYEAYDRGGVTEFSHGAALMLLTPDGRVARYLRGLDFDPITLEYSLVDAGEGTVSQSLLAHIRYFCSRYDPETGRYTADAMRIMQLGGALTVIVLGTVLIVFWRREARRRGAAGATPSAADAPAPGAPAPAVASVDAPEEPRP